MTEERSVPGTSVTGSYILSVDALMTGVKLNVWHCRRLPILVLLMLSLVIPWVVWGLRSPEKPPPWIPMLVIMGILVTSMAYGVFRGSRKRLAKIPGIGGTVTWWLDDKGISLRGDGFESSLGWKLTYSALVTEKGILIYPQKGLFYWLPKTAFPEPVDWDKARNLVTRHAPRCKTV